MPADHPEPAPLYQIPHPADAAEHHRRWAAHVDAGRIGTRADLDPEIVANRARTSAAFGHDPS